MHLLEEEVIVDQLLLVLLGHTLKWVELTLEVALEGVACLNNLVHDLKSLLLGDTWTKWVTGKVSSNSNSSGDDHGAVLLGELSVLDALRGHLGGVRGVLTVAVVLLDDLVKKLLELLVSIVGAGVETNARIEVLDTGEDASLECNA